VQTSDLIAKMMEKIPQPAAVKDITGLEGLKDALKESTNKAADAHNKAVDTARSVTEKALGELPNAIKAEATAKEAEAAKRKTEEAEQEKKQKTEEDEQEKKRKSAIEKLTANLTSYIAFAGAAPDDKAAVSRAKGIVDGLFGQAVPAPDAASFYDKLKIAAGDDAATQQGKNAFLEVLGLKK
jgi:hypothetical protein